MSDKVVLAQSGIEIILAAGLMSAIASLGTAIATWLKQKKWAKKFKPKYAEEKVTPESLPAKESSEEKVVMDINQYRGINAMLSENIENLLHIEKANREVQDGDLTNFRQVDI